MDSEKLKKLENAKEVMEAFLAGYKLINNGYGGDESGDLYLYLGKSGYIHEEDKATAKMDYIGDLSFRGEDPNWRILG